MARKNSGRSSRTGSSSRSAAPAAELLEEVEGSVGMGVEGGIVITTFLFLAVAIAMVVMASQRYA